LKGNKMNQSLSTASTRNQAIKEFNMVRMRALLNAWVAKILRQSNGPRSLVGSNVTGLCGRRLARTRRIRVDQIVGTVRYTDEFDKNFRPLNEQARDRWVHVFVELNEDRWRPIVVHKVGESYYVAKGQYQVSVARCTGIKFIEAQVWDHSAGQTSDGPCLSKHEPLRQRTGSFSTN
jgi:hypothetical protein